MALSELEVARISKLLTAFCERRVPARVRDKARVGFHIRGGEIELFESRPSFHRPQEWHEAGVAKFRYVRAKDEWRLYCQCRDLRWHQYQRRPAARSFDQTFARG